MTAVSGETLNAEAGSSEVMVFSKDGVHPYPNTGHRVYTEAIKRAWGSLDRRNGAMEHILPEPLMPDCVEKVTTLLCDDPALRKSGRVHKYEGGTPQLDWLTKRTGLFRFEPGAEFSFKFMGSGQHTVRVRVTGRSFDKRSLLLKDMQEAYDSDPSKFAPKNYYLGKIFILGEL